LSLSKKQDTWFQNKDRIFSRYRYRCDSATVLLRWTLALVLPKLMPYALQAQENTEEKPKKLLGKISRVLTHA